MMLAMKGEPKPVNAYILTILAAALIASVAELLAPKGDGGRIAAHVRMIAGLFLLVVLLHPLKEGLLLLESAADGEWGDQIADQLPDHIPGNHEAVFNHTLTAIGEQEAEDWVTAALSTVFGIPSASCTVEAACGVEEQMLTLKEIRIALQGKYMLENPHPIESYVTEQLGCPCFVTVYP